MNFRQLDLNLLRVLVAVHRSGSVTAAGRALSLSQSATSNALARLRYFFQDDLFVRSPAGLQRTRLCEQLAPAVATHLLSLETLVTGMEQFDPAQSDTTWRLSLSDLGEILFLPPLASALRQRAPHTRVANVAVAATAVASALEAREIDCAVGILQPRHRGVHADLLFREQYVAVTHPDWRPGRGGAGASLSRSQLETASLVVASPTATFHSSVEDMLVKHQLADRIVLRARHFGALPELVAGSDLLAIVPAMYAASRPGLRVWKLPFAPRYEVRLVWHASTARDPAQQWFRELLNELFGREPAQARR
ncbi:LysR family transcriptional regulator [Ramlibacter solisilvae]|uniref:LysR family transcriptional regulator n=1 Tax=Ramlibacter tataouinensis TaxID=94132 RepID=A0A127JXT6_9BURK|nr:LysR family transcriptional regulator [Ramlibacter tataouinensis]AMO24673.1 LysR family transcriptional regulator [Ramlibacter tataouinensis]